MGDNSAEVVFLLHGIGKGSLDMMPLARRMRRHGYQAVNWHYPSTRTNLADIAAQLAEAVAKFETTATTVHFITHSMGGIVARTYLAGNSQSNLGRLVMIAPPNQGALLADILADWRLYKMFFGPAGQELKRGQSGRCVSAGIPSIEFGTIAGGLGRSIGINPLLPGDNDGTVQVESTYLENATDFVLVPYPHPVIHMMPRTADLAIRFLQEGTFQSAAHLTPSAAVSM